MIEVDICAAQKSQTNGGGGIWQELENGLQKRTSGSLRNWGAWRQVLVWGREKSHCLWGGRSSWKSISTPKQKREENEKHRQETRVRFCPAKG